MREQVYCLEDLVGLTIEAAGQDVFSDMGVLCLSTDKFALFEELKIAEEPVFDGYWAPPVSLAFLIEAGAVADQELDEAIAEYQKRYDERQEQVGRKNLARLKAMYPDNEDKS